MTTVAVFLFQQYEIKIYHHYFYGKEYIMAVDCIILISKNGGYRKTEIKASFRRLF